MNCEKCGTSIREGVIFCPACGAKVAAQDFPSQDLPQEQQVLPQEQPQMQYQGQYQEQPQYQYQPQPQYQGQPQYQSYQQYQYGDRGKNAKVVGILALVFGCMGGFVGIILGFVGLSMSNKVLVAEPGNRSAQVGRTCSLIGLILGIIIMVAVVAANA